MSSPAESFARTLLERAIVLNAADIHIEPFEHFFQIRVRTPNGLQTFPSPDRSLFTSLVRHFKLLAGLDIATESTPQDGKFILSLGGGSVEFRLSALPTLYGPSIVLRVLDRERVPLKLQSLVFEENILNELRLALTLPFGMIVVAGKTGSGKTTTLYACVRELAAEKTKKILSVEDPVEFALSGVQQVNVNENFSFPMALRSFLRHDPDVIFVGEIRDRETARLAIQTALTGHLVLTSLHTKGPAEVITRLIDLGVEKYLIDSALKFVLSQEIFTQNNERTVRGEIYWHKNENRKQTKNKNRNRNQNERLLNVAH